MFDFVAARGAISGVVARTPLVRSAALSERAGREVFLKLENLQVTGSFKARGAASKLLSLDAAQRGRGVVACSSGNHGLAVAHVARSLGMRATICVPTWVDSLKLAAIQATGARVVVGGDTYDQAERDALALQEREGLILIHPFDDPLVIAGQGTIALELLEDLPELDTVVVPVSGGGLIAGVATAIKQRRPGSRVVGVSAEKAAAMLASLAAGRPVELEEEPTVASALAGNIGLDNRHSFDLVRQNVDEHVTVSEEEILGAMRHLLLREHLVVEGGGAVGVAALLEGKLPAGSGPLVLVLSGGNVDPLLLGGILVAEG